MLMGAQTYTHLLARRVRPDCGVARSVIAGQTADQRGNLNLHDVGEKKPQSLETCTQTHHSEPQHSNTIHYCITEHIINNTPKHSARAQQSNIE